MEPDDVPPDEMPMFPLGPDPIDAARRGEPVDDVSIAALVHDLRSAYLPDEPRSRSAALAAFAGPGAATVDPGAARPDLAPVVPLAAPRSRRRRAAVGVAAFAATLAGKVVLGGAVAAATLGGLHAADVVDVPLLPEVPRSPAAPTTVPDVADPVELPATADAPPASPATPAEVSPPTDAPGSGPAVVEPKPGDDTNPADPANRAGEPADQGHVPSTVPPTTGSPPTTGPPADTPAAGQDPSGDVRAGDSSDARTHEPGEPAREDFATNP